MHNALIFSSCIERVTLSHPLNGFQIQALRKPMLLPQPTAGSDGAAWGIEALSVSRKATACGWCGFAIRAPEREHVLQIRASRWWLCGCRAESPTRVFPRGTPKLNKNYCCNEFQPWALISISSPSRPMRLRPNSDFVMWPMILTSFTWIILS